MADWSVLDRTDPAPGNPAGVRELARRLNDEASTVRGAVTRLDAVANGTDALRMQGDYAPGYRAALTELPGELKKYDPWGCLGRPQNNDCENVTKYPLLNSQHSPNLQEAT
jgi:hypothetical protein